MGPRGPERIRPGRLLEGIKPLVRLRENPVDFAAAEFMKIEDIEEAKKAIIKVFRGRLLDPSMKDKGFTHSEINTQVRELSRVFDYAKDKHDGKKRLTGENYIFHPASIAFMMLSDSHIPIDKLTEAAYTALCHDILEDTPTTPRELRDEIGAEATRNVILLSKNMKVFDKSPSALEVELQKAGSKPTIDEIELVRWAQRRDGTKIERLHLHMNEIFDSSDLVKRARGYDRLHNLLTLPPLVPPADGPPRSDDDQRKIEKIWSEIFPETRVHIFPIVLSLGKSGYPLFRSLRKVYKEKKPH